MNCGSSVTTNSMSGFWRVSIPLCQYSSDFIHNRLATWLLKPDAKPAIIKDDRTRKSSLDELPQLWSILVGDMSFVGPRPALFNQDDLISLRTQVGVDALVPGLTGWAQVNGRDELPIPEKVKLDAQYLQRQSLGFDIRILWLTFVKVLRRDGVSH